MELLAAVSVPQPQLHSDRIDGLAKSSTTEFGDASSAHSLGCLVAIQLHGAIPTWSPASWPSRRRSTPTRPPPAGGSGERTLWSGSSSPPRRCRKPSATGCASTGTSQDAGDACCGRSCPGHWPRTGSSTPTVPTPRRWPRSSSLRAAGWIEDVAVPIQLIAGTDDAVVDLAFLRHVAAVVDLAFLRHVAEAHAHVSLAVWPDAEHELPLTYPVGVRGRDRAAACVADARTGWVTPSSRARPDSRMTRPGDGRPPSGRGGGRGGESTGRASRRSRPRVRVASSRRRHALAGGNSRPANPPASSDSLT